MAKAIIKTNQEEEEKIKLFNDKVDELKTLFTNSSLDKLKEISFIKEKKNGSYRKRTELAPEGDGNGSKDNQITERKTN